MNLTGKTIVVSGGASGLGAATVEMVVANGGHAVILDRNETAGQALAARFGTAVDAIGVDLTHALDTAEAVRQIAAARGPIHGLVCTAGIAPAERVISKDGVQPLEHFEHVVRVNLFGTFNVLRVVAEHLAANPPDAEGERGVIVMTASVAAYEGQIGQAAYAASKAGIVGMTLPLAREFARTGIRVVTIAPGIFDTPLLAALPDATRASLGQQVPFPPRLGRPTEFAALVQHIFENVMLNGDTIRLDGAIRMAPR